jgi:hypothetical protein
MKSLQIVELPDEVYDVIENRARQTGRSPAEQAAEMLARSAAEELREATLMEEIRKDREEMARKGVYLTEEDIQSAIDWGRE